MTQVETWRKITSGLLGAGAALSVIVFVGHEALIVITIIAGLLAAAAAVHSSGFGAQLFARAMWWSGLALGLILCLDGTSKECPPGIALALGCGTALLVIGRKGLAEASERAAYAPAAFRSSLLLLMVLALADAQTFALMAIIELRNGLVKEGSYRFALLSIATLAFVAGFVGLYRVRIWGALANASVAFVMFILAMFSVMGFRDILRVYLLGITGLQVLAALPLLLGLFTSLRLPSLPGRVRQVAAVAGVVLIMVVSVVAASRGSPW